MIILCLITANKMQLVLLIQTALCDLHDLILANFIKNLQQDSVCGLVNLIAKLIEKNDLSLLIYVYTAF